MVGGSKSHMAGWTYHTWLDQGLTPHGCNSHVAVGSNLLWLENMVFPPFKQRNDHSWTLHSPFESTTDITYSN